MTTFRNPTDHTGVSTETEAEREEREATLAGHLTEATLAGHLAAEAQNYADDLAEWMRERQAFGLADVGPFPG